MTQEQVASSVGVDPVSFRHYEYGKRFPKPEILEALARCFNVSESALFVRGQANGSRVDLKSVLASMVKHSDLIELIAQVDDDYLESLKYELEAYVEQKVARDSGVNNTGS